ncbi:NAD-dependent epimerase/dehydratase family protein [Stenotrophomonas maltophilia]|uniref:NAD-dependent epimerase/dehydratase family protein n=1 Tax=Stenotrophomonas maltophilia TaxID=40324 RepID=UPI000C1488C4|nr:NAD-dependent epimerase/dehydratase family protein [Stenotrophomonas maltophilia]ELK6804178.1 NAD-dependent epimerase/dehydratase family protein [Stenotrophomonas maltophilia]MCU1135944.1 NAD-dependent epimerase/dehydratase family protein [Stenotrophomonas maltophilia]MDW7599024.1 NAD-dependent epimerase/dehydratase family protein [Stenotrophomonas maltophilia]QNA94702.1 NAD-dependent epimerase/dehydratase family protein [Stenotrophomonas maltophilia]HDS1073829.1 NAD-dependent epimerase/deh
MIIGRGLVATAFAPDWQDDPETVIVAAGVSNSSETESAAFAREERLLDEIKGMPSIQRIVYFGSCAVGNPAERQTPYLQHKARMEARVLADPRGRVFRLPQVVGEGGNPHTLTNFLRARIESGEPFDVWARAERNLIDIRDVATLGTHVLRHPDDYPRMMPLADVRSTNMLEIVRAMESVLERQGNYRVLEQGVAFPIDTCDCERAAAACGVPLGEGYLLRLLGRYYVAASRA